MIIDCHRLSSIVINLNRQVYVYKGERFRNESILDVRTHHKPTETFQYTNFHSCHPPGVKKRIYQRRSVQNSQNNSSENTFEGHIKNFEIRLTSRGYPVGLVKTELSEVKFTDRKSALKQKNKAACKRILPFVTQYHPALPRLKSILMEKWHLIQNQPTLREIFKEPPILS